MAPTTSAATDERIEGIGGSSRVTAVVGTGRAERSAHWASRTHERLACGDDVGRRSDGVSEPHGEVEASERGEGVPVDPGQARGSGW